MKVVKKNLTDKKKTTPVEKPQKQYSQKDMQNQVNVSERHAELLTMTFNLGRT